MRRTWRAAWIGGWLLIGAECAFGHALAPSLLDLREAKNGRIEVLWKTALQTVPGVVVAPVLPSSCRTLSAPVQSIDHKSRTLRWNISCNSLGLSGQTLQVAGLGDSKTDVLLRIHLADGRLFRYVLSGRQPSVTVPERAAPALILCSYLMLGFEHILTGFDHLLFVLGLVLLVHGARMLIPTITSFTLGHSVTLSLVALGWVRFPSAPVEIAIALSILVMAVELSRIAREEQTDAGKGLAERFPWALAFGFGLLHGLGFAGVLAEVGLPATEIPLALASFNIGIELGQLLFVLVIVILLRLSRAVPEPRLAWGVLVSIYLMGVTSAYWSLERLVGIF